MQNNSPDPNASNKLTINTIERVQLIINAQEKLIHYLTALRARTHTNERVKKISQQWRINFRNNKLNDNDGEFALQENKNQTTVFKTMQRCCCCTATRRAAQWKSIPFLF